MALLRGASKEYGFDLSLADIARIWKGGCIIRAKVLDPIKEAFTEEPDLVNLMVAQPFARILTEAQVGWHRAVVTAVQAGVPCLALGASLGYFDAYHSARLPARSAAVRAFAADRWKRRTGAPSVSSSRTGA